MICVVGVRFKKAGKVYYFDPAELPITKGDKVVVETARGVEYGEVAVGPKDVDDDQVVQPLKKVLRIGNEKDAVVAAENKRKESEAFGVAQKKIEAHSLEMNLVDVEYTFDGSKIIFYFTAEGRIDFRELVRDLASVFRTRIEMRQIGVRDEAKLLGGIGPCGRILCCTSFLGDFAPVSIRMAKDQNLSLNPSKISGLCGRLMCCLRYEQETYEAAKKDPTQAPGYVPPMVDEPVPDLAELEDRPMPAIGIRMPKREAGGMSARIAQAAGMAERPQRRESGAGSPEPRRERQQGGDRQPMGDRPVQKQGSGPARPQGQGAEQRRERPQGGGGRPQGQPSERSRPQGGADRQQQPGKGRNPAPQQPQAGGESRRERTQGGTTLPGEKRSGQPQQQKPQGARPPQAERQGGAEAAAEGGNKEQNRSRHHRHRRRGGGGQGGQNPQGGGTPPA
jgi:cell fate regulator YaaT (PSP1 superfamily)